MYIFLDNLHQGGKYSSQIASQMAELKIEGKFTDQKYLSISSLQTDYLNLDSRSECGRNSGRENLVHTKCAFCGGANHSAENVSKDQKRKGEISCGWRFGQYMHRTYASYML